jgi:hypothetical protein
MTPTDLPVSINAFFDSYRTAFEQRNAAAIADHFAYPGLVISDADGITLAPIPNRQEWMGRLEQLLGMYRVIEVATAQILDLKVIEISPRLVIVHVHWDLRTAADASLYDFTAIYTLAQLEGAFHITALAHDEMPHYRACLTRLKAQHA